MTTDDPDSPLQVLARIPSLLADAGITDFAITGGVAFGVWAEPRATRDIDLCGVVPPAAVDRLLAMYDGVRSGPDEIPDVIRFRVGDWDVDLFAAKGRYYRTCLDRAVTEDLAGVRLKVVTREDLVIQKLIKLRSDRHRLLQDLSDLRALLLDDSRPLDRTYVDPWLEKDEIELLHAVATLDDEELVKRLLAR